MNESTSRIKIVGINGRYTHSCLALFYVRNELEKNCSDVVCELCQFTINDNYYEMVLRLSDGEPDFIFFSSAIWNSALIDKLIIDLQNCLPECWLVIGGPQASTIKEKNQISRLTVVSGAIESVEAQFYQDLVKGCLKQAYGRSFFAMSTRDFSFPYRENDFVEHLQNRHVYYESSRGCPFGCTYCLSASETGLFHKDLDTVCRELGTILSHRPKVVRFIDRTFNDVPERALKIWEFLRDYGGDTLFHFEMAPDRISTEMFAFLETLDLGRFQFEIGIQSTNRATLEAVNRRIEPETAKLAVQKLSQLGSVHLHVDLILGLPFDTKESFAQSFRDIFSMGAHYIQMGLLKILPQTPISLMVEEFGYIYSQEPPYSILANKWLSHQQLAELYWYSECVEKFINNRYFGSLWKYLRQSREDIFVFFEKLLVRCKNSDFFERPATQELMAQKLVEIAAKRDDSELFLELMRYDWLRCGFRFLPDCLVPGSDKEQPHVTRSKLYQSMPAEVDGLYKKSTRNQFFRKSYFLRLAQKTVNELDLNVDYEHPCLCVLQEKESGIHNYNKSIILEC